MKNATYRRNPYCLYDYRGVEEHLSTMAAQGWRLEKAGTTFWKYRRADPANLRYAVTYSDSASQYNPGPTEDQRFLADLCAAAGWTKVSDWFQMQIFSTEDPDAVPLETDEALRLENIHRSMKKNFIPVNTVLLFLMLFLSRDFLLALATGNLYKLLSRNTVLLIGPLALALVAFQLYTLCAYFLWRRRSLRSVAEGGVCLPAGRGYRRGNLAMGILLLTLAPAYLLLELGLGNGGAALYFVLYMVLFRLIHLVVLKTTSLLRKRQVSKTANIAWTLAVDAVLCAALLGGLLYGRVFLGWFSDGLPAGETYEYRDRQWDVSPRQDFPLTQAELTGEEYGHVHRQLENRGSFFIPVWNYSETALLRDGPKVCELDYTLWELSSPRMRQFLMEDLLKDEVYRYKGITMLTMQYRPEDPAPWRAEAVYRHFWNEGAVNTWLLVWPGRVARIRTENAPTEEQKALIAARLAPEDWKEETP